MSCDDAVFAQQPAYLIYFSGALSHQFSSDSVQCLDILLLDGFDRNETHAGTPHGFADRFSIVGVVLVSFDVGLHELWGDELDRVPQFTEPARPVVRTGTGFQPDQTGGQTLEELHHLTAPQLAAQERFAVTIDAVYLEDFLCQINANAGNLHVGLLSSIDWWITLPSLAHRCRFRREESIPLILAWVALIAL